MQAGSVLNSRSVPSDLRAQRLLDGVRVSQIEYEAVGELESSTIAPAAFGEDVHYHLVNTARQEWARANRVVTDWELARNFERI